MKYIDDNGIWWHLNDSNEDLYKLLLNPDTNKPYRKGQVIQQGFYKGKVFLHYRYDRLLRGDRKFWGIRYSRGVKSLSLDNIEKGYRIPAPALISFSGGRTSGYMLRKILDVYDNNLPKDVHVCFANTGKEMPETLDFVKEVQEQWKVDIHWLELKINKERPIWTTQEVNHKTASRDGKPFYDLIKKRKALPNPVMRFCTQELKVNTIKRYMKGLGIQEWYNVLGLRYDEPSRILRASGANCYDCWLNLTPLHDKKISNEDVLKFWNKNSFDLQLPSIDGKTVAGNCDLCYLKSTKTIVNLIAEKPELTNWWVEREKEHSSYFRKDRPEYSRLIEISKEDKHNLIDDDQYSCFCHD